MSILKINLFLFWKLPAAFWCGVRVYALDRYSCVVRVRHRWINQNPFGSMYFAVQAMAAELSTGALLVYTLRALRCDCHMLVLRHEGEFIKKARGRISFTCTNGNEVTACLQNITEEPVVLTLQSVGHDESGDVVARFTFTWSLKLKRTLKPA